jgi:hypothetical protein
MNDSFGKGFLRIISAANIGLRNEFTARKKEHQMDWHELTANWDLMAGRLQTRFPEIDRDSFVDPPRDSRALTNHLAEVQNLSIEDARAALDDFMRVQDTTRKTPKPSTD